MRRAFDDLAQAGRTARRAGQRRRHQPSGLSAADELERFRQTLAIDLTGVYATILAAYPLLKKAGSGSIINVTSINSVRGFPGNPGYVAAKAGLAGLTRALADGLSRATASASTRWRPAMSRPR